MVPQVGQKKFVFAFAYSPDARFLATGSHDNTVLIWETATFAHQVLTGHSNAVLRLAFSPDSKYLVSKDGAFNFHVWDVENKKWINSLEYRNDELSSPIFFRNNSEILFVDDKGLNLWNIHTDKPSLLIPFPGNALAVNSNHSEAIIINAQTSSSFEGFTFTTTFTSDLRRYNLSNNTLINTDWINSIGTEWTNAAYSPSGNQIVLTDREQIVHVVDLSSRRRVWRSNAPAHRFVISDDEKFMYAFSSDGAGNNTVLVLDYATGRQVSRIEQLTDFGLAYSHSLRQLAGGTDAGDYFYRINTFDLESGRMVRSFNPDRNEFYRLGWDQALNRLEVTGNSGSATWDLRMAQITDYESRKQDYRYPDAFSKGRMYQVVPVIEEMGRGTFAYRVLSGIEVRDAASRPVLKKELQGIRDAQLSLDETRLFIATADQITVLELPGGREIMKKDFPDTSPNSLALSPDGSTLAVGKFWLQSTENLTKWYNPDYSIELLDARNLNSLRVLQGHFNMVMDLVFTDRFLASASTDGTVRLWDPDTGAMKALLLGAAADDYFIGTVDGYYSSSRNALHRVAFMDQSGRLFPARVFEAINNRPDKVAQFLGYADDRIVEAFRMAHQRRLQQLGLSDAGDGTRTIPQISISNLPANVVDQERVRLSYDVSDPQHGLSHLRVTVNNVPVTGFGRIDLNNQRRASGNIDLVLSSGTNTIEITAANSLGTSSLPFIYEVFNRAETVPELYLVTIGVDTFQNPEYNLNWAVKDAGDLAGLFKSQNVGYGRIHHFHLVNEQVTRENILALGHELGSSRVDDHVVIFVATHGLFDQDFQYYLATHDTDFSRPETRAISYSALEGMLEDIPSRQKLILMDACHSGEVDETEMALGQPSRLATSGGLNVRGFRLVQSAPLGLENSFELMKKMFADLREGTGATVIAAAGGAEFAFESEEWSNGAFTFSIIEGVRERKADLNRDAFISLSELQRYVFSRVREITDGGQNPTVRVENIAHDYDLFSTFSRAVALFHIVGQWTAVEEADHQGNWRKVTHAGHQDFEVSLGADGFHYISYGFGVIRLDPVEPNQYITVQREGFYFISENEVIKDGYSGRVKYARKR